MTERGKMLAGELYDPFDPELVAARERARDLCQDLNATRESQQQERRRILLELFGNGGDSVWMQPPFFCDYGTNIELGERAGRTREDVRARLRYGGRSCFGLATSPRLSACRHFTADLSELCAVKDPCRRGEQFLILDADVPLIQLLQISQALTQFLGLERR